MNEAIKQPVAKRAAGYWHFMREFVRNPRQMGAICPSSPFLARRMASLVPQGEGIVVELGPGGGAVTAALLNQGIDANELVLVERSAFLCRQLSKRFPGVQLIEGDAMHLSRFDALRQQPVRAVVSSLPLRSLPRLVVRQILDQVALVSGPGTVLIQFSYALHGSYQGLAHGFERDQAHLVWRNLPPARIEAFCFRPRQMQ